MLCEGRTDAQGRLNLSGDDEKLVAETYARQPNDVWIRSRGNLRPLALVFEREDWTIDRKSIEAMSALDYSAAPHAGLGGEDQRRDEAMSRADTGAAGHVLWAELNKL